MQKYKEIKKEETSRNEISTFWKTENRRRNCKWLCGEEEDRKLRDQQKSRELQPLETMTPRKAELSCRNKN